MKPFNQLLVFNLFFLIALFSACNSTTSSNNKTAIDSSKVVAVDFKIEGMTCKMGCAKTIEKTIAGLNGVVVSAVDFDAEKGHFEFDESIITEKEIISAIENVANQYKVEPWKEQEQNSEENTPAETKTGDKSVANVKLIPSIKIPNLFKLLINQL